jgi:WD40 repeat protein
MKVFSVLFFGIVSMLLTGCFKLDVYTAKANTSVNQSEIIVKAVDISKDGKYSLIADNQGVCLWNNQTNKLVHQCLSGDEKKFIEVVKISNNNRFYATSNRIFVNFYSIATGQRIAQWSDAENILNDLDMSDDGSILLLGFRSGKINLRFLTNIG